MGSYCTAVQLYILILHNSEIKVDLLLIISYYTKLYQKIHKWKKGKNAKTIKTFKFTTKKCIKLLRIKMKEEGGQLSQGKSCIVSNLFLNYVLVKCWFEMLSLSEIDFSILKFDFRFKISFIRNQLQKKFQFQIQTSNLVMFPEARVSN